MIGLQPAKLYPLGGETRYILSSPGESRLKSQEQMTLHRDVHWVGRQWAVTGYGIQACDQKQKSRFDIEASRIWEDGLPESLRNEPWFNSEDFCKALAVARSRFPEPPQKAPAPSNESTPRPAEKPANKKFTGLGETNSNGKSLEQPISNPTNAYRPDLGKTTAGPDQLRPPERATQTFEMHIRAWPAKFVSQWRVRIRR